MHGGAYLLMISGGYMARIDRKKKRRMLFRRKRTLDPQLVIDYKNPDTLKRFITDRGKIIPRRISGATTKQQRLITNAVKRARYLALLPFSVAHKTDKNFAAEMTAYATAAATSRPKPYKRREDRPATENTSKEGDS
jgi:small subunit ribosomal protein S18